MLTLLAPLFTLNSQSSVKRGGCGNCGEEKLKFVLTIDINMSFTDNNSLEPSDLHGNIYYAEIGS